jgi:formylglycine-generating enzyme required for sulfatase activity
VSIGDVMPSANITWFQAQQACGNSRKRLPSNAEWQLAATGSPDPGHDVGGSCDSTSERAAKTGTRLKCVSAWNAYDMVGNLWELAADWLPRSTTSGSWSFASDDYQFIGGAATSGEPGVLIRGGGFLDRTVNGGSGAGPLAIDGFYSPFSQDADVGFRCAR